LAVLVDRRARRWSAARQTLANTGGGPNSGNLKSIGPSGSPRAFLKPKSKGPGTVLRVPMLNPKLFQLALRSRSQQQQQQNQQQQQERPQDDNITIEDEEEDAEASPSSSSGTRPRVTTRLAPTMKGAVPFLRSHIMKAGRGGRSNNSRSPLRGSPPDSQQHQPKPRSCSVIDEDSV